MVGKRFSEIGKAGGKLFLAGPEYIADERKIKKRDRFLDELDAQEEGFDGEKKGHLLVCSAEDGSEKGRRQRQTFRQPHERRGYLLEVGRGVPSAPPGGQGTGRPTFPNLGKTAAKVSNVWNF